MKEHIPQGNLFSLYVLLQLSLTQHFTLVRLEDSYALLWVWDGHGKTVVGALD